MPHYLVIKPSSFGDIVHGLQVAESLKTQSAEPVRFTWVVREVFAPLVETCSTVDNVLIFKRKGGASGFLKLLKMIRQSEFDGVIDMQGLARSGLMTLAARAPLKMGRSDAREGAGLFYDVKVPLPEKPVESTHAVEILLEFLPLIDASTKKEVQGRLSFPHVNPEAFTRELLLKKPILLFPESRRPEKNWPGFESLTELLLNRYPKSPVIWLGMSSLPVKPEWKKRNFLDLQGKTRIDELALLIEHATLVIANDSGPMHLAAALSVPVIAIFGPTPPEKYGPFPLDRPTNHVIRAPEGDLERLTVDRVMADLTRIYSTS